MSVPSLLNDIENFKDNVAKVERRSFVIASAAYPMLFIILSCVDSKLEPLY